MRLVTNELADTFSAALALHTIRSDQHQETDAAALANRIHVCAKKCYNDIK